MTKKKDDNESRRFRVFVRPQSVCDYFIATMDPKDPFKICLYPSVKNQAKNNLNGNDPDEMNDLLLNNYLNFKRSCLRDKYY